MPKRVAVTKHCYFFRNKLYTNLDPLESILIQRLCNTRFVMFILTVRPRFSIRLIESVMLDATFNLLKRTTITFGTMIDDSHLIINT